MDISFRIKRINSKSYYIPVFMDMKESPAVKEVLNHFEHLVGQHESELDSSFIYDIFSDRKIAKGLFHVITKWYYDLKGIEILENDHLSLIEYRIKFFEYLEKLDKTWIPKKEQEKIFNSFKDQLNIPENSSVIDLIFADHSKNFKIIRKNESIPQEKEVLLRYNTELIKFLIYKAYYIEFSFPSTPETSGMLIKRLIRLSKIWKIEINLSQETSMELKEKIINVKILGPSELVGRNIKYSNNLFSYIIQIHNNLLQAKVADLKLQIQFFETRKDILLDLNNYPATLGLENSFNKLSEPFDSKIEHEFYKKFKSNYSHWQITREPIIIENNIIMIPDFLLEYHNAVFYLEIIGFWTERYLSKKYQKLNLLKDDYPNMILFIDKSLDFPIIEDLPTFYYSSKKIPMLELGSYLMQMESKAFSTYFNTLNSNKLIKSINKNLESNNFIELNKISELWSISDSFDIINIIKEIFTELKNELDIFISLDPIFLMKCSFLQDFQNYLKQEKDNLMITIIQKNFPDLNEKAIKKVMSFLGYRFKYKTLLDEKIIIPKKEFILDSSYIS